MCRIQLSAQEAPARDSEESKDHVARTAVADLRGNGARAGRETIDCTAESLRRWYVEARSRG